jgi:hypothetical protein
VSSHVEDAADFHAMLRLLVVEPLSIGVRKEAQKLVDLRLG